MKKYLVTICLCMVLISSCFAKDVIKASFGTLYDYKDSTCEIGSDKFSARIRKDYKTIDIRFESKSHNKTFSLVCDSYVEILRLIKVNDNLYWFDCNSLGFQQFFIWDLISDSIYEPFFDMKNDVSIYGIDYENKILFGDSWNSDKGIMPNQKIELFLFSTPRQKHYKIAEKYGDEFYIKVLGNNKIQYKDNTGKEVSFDYSDWIEKNISYTASSFLIEGETIYSPDNLSSKDGIPWASANGYGINDTITIKNLNCNTTQLTLYNGFQSKNRPDLYKANSRVKKIRIKNLENGRVKDYILQDIPDMQTISLQDFNTPANNLMSLEITILEVYSGDKYKDLCIQAIIPRY